MTHDVDFIASSFGGGWLFPLNVNAQWVLTDLFDGDEAAPIMPCGGRHGWIVEPSDMEWIAGAMKDAGLWVEEMA